MEKGAPNLPESAIEDIIEKKSEKVHKRENDSESDPGA
jgi:hypothetical protein